MRKVSFLIAAHNEEKIIGKTLQNLIEIPYDDYEVLVGLDGCTDKTEDIVKNFSKKSSKIKFYNLKSRGGKPEVIDHIIKKSKGEIIVINDADWLFRVRNKEEIEKFFSVFDNPKIGGIAESFPVEWDKDKLRISNFGYKVVAYGNYYWMDSQKRKFTRSYGNFLFITEPAMFLTNIFRKKLYEKNFSLGDDFERTRLIKKRGFEIALFNEEKFPRMIASYDKIFLRDLFKQKVRTALARSQIHEKGEDLKKYEYQLGKYIIINSWRKSLLSGFYATSWLVLAFLGEIISKFKRKKDTRSGWLLRAER